MEQASARSVRSVPCLALALAPFVSTASVEASGPIGSRPGLE